MENKDYVAKHRDLRKSAGQKRVEIWVHASRVEELRKLAKPLEVAK